MGYTCAIVYNDIFENSVTPCMMAVVGAGSVLAGVTHTLSVCSKKESKSFGRCSHR
jgi:hypothetical protein